MEKVSMIMPCYNAAQWLDRTLMSILNQDYDNIELIVVNDASSDSTEEKLAEWTERFRKRGYEYVIVKREENGGLCAAINTGLSLYSGKYLCFPDADDYLYPDYVSSLVNALKDDPCCGWAICGAEYVFEGSQETYPLRICDTSIYKSDFCDMLSARTPHNAWLIMVRSEYFKKCIGHQILDSRLTQEWPLLFPLSFYGNCKRVTKTLYRYIRRSSSMAAWVNGAPDDVIAHIKGLRNLAEEVLSHLPLSIEDRKKAKTVLDLHYGFRIYEAYVRSGRNEEAQKIERQLYAIVGDTIGCLNTSSVKMLVEYAIDDLLEVRMNRVADHYEKIRKSLENGYIIYGAGRMAEYLSDSMTAAFGPPEAVWDAYAGERELCGIQVKKPDYTFAKLPVIIAIGNEIMARDAQKVLKSNGFRQVHHCGEVLDALRGFRLIRSKYNKGKNKKLVSMVIPCYNAGPYIDYMFRSILAQHYDNVEVIAVNDASVDNTAQKLEMWRIPFKNRGFQYHIITRERNGGLCAAINEGLRRFSGEYVCFPDADDWLYPDYLRLLTNALEENPSYGWARCNAEWVREEEPDKRWRVIRNPADEPSIGSFKRLLSYRTPLFAWLLMARRDYILKCIPIRQIYESRATQEFGIAFPLAYHGDYITVDKILYRYIYHKRSSSSVETENGIERAQRYLEDVERTYHKVLQDLPLSDELRDLTVHTGNLVYLRLRYELLSKYNMWKEPISDEICEVLLKELRVIYPETEWDKNMIFSFIIPLSELCMNKVLGVVNANAVKMYSTMKKLVNDCGGYMIYGAGNAASYLLPSLIDALGRPLSILDRAAGDNHKMSGIPVVRPGIDLLSSVPVIVAIKDEYTAENVMRFLRDRNVHHIFSYEDTVSALCGELLEQYPGLGVLK